MPTLTANREASRIPSGLPTTSPRATAKATDEVNDDTSMGTPALAKANSGTMTNADQGCSAPSRYSSGEMVSLAAH